MKLSIVIGTRNRDQNLKYLLKSISFQDFNLNECEVVVVNYGGESSTKTLVDKFHFPHQKYIYVNEAGIFNESRSKNIGIKHAKGKTIICTNADIIFPRNLLKDFYNLYKKNGNNFLYQIRRFDIPENYDLEQFVKVLEKRLINNQRFLLQDQSACGDFQATSKEKWYQVTGYDERMSGWGGMDLDLVDRMEKIDTKQYWIDPEVLAIYHTYHPTKAPAKTVINLELKRIPKKPKANETWGEIRYIPKVYILANHINNTKSLFTLLKEAKQIRNYRTFIIANCLTTKSGNNLEKYSNHKSVNVSSKEFFQLLRNYALYNYADYIIEIDKLKFLDSKQIVSILDLLKTRDCVLADSYTHPPLINTLSQSLFGNCNYSNIRAYNSRLAKVLTYKYFAPTYYFYQPQFYRHCLKLEQDINSYRNSTNESLLEIDIRLLLTDFYKLIFKNYLTKAIKPLKQTWDHLKLPFTKDRANTHQVPYKKIILGAGGTRQEGFWATDIDILDITNPLDWSNLFVQNNLQNLLTEHVLEHLDMDQIKKSLKLCYQYLAPKGRLRIAVPDANRTDTNYVMSITPPIDGHKVYLDYKDLTKLLVEAGFTKIKPLEYFDESGQFHHLNWDPKQGKIKRSYKYDHQKRFKMGKLYYTSLIVDALK